MSSSISNLSLHRLDQIDDSSEDENSRHKRSVTTSLSAVKYSSQECSDSPRVMKLTSVFTPEHALLFCMSQSAKRDGISCQLAGCLLIADISGFTKLSAAACDKGSAGLDAFRVKTDAFLRQVIDRIYEQQGEVLFFAGDALICLFRPEHEVTTSNNTKWVLSSECCLRAVAAALAIASVRSKELQAHVGICAGDIMLGTVGGYRDAWSLLVTCPHIQSLAQCLSDADIGQVVVTPEVIRGRLSGLVEAEQLQTGNYLIRNVVKSLDRKHSHDDTARSTSSNNSYHSTNNTRHSPSHSPEVSRKHSSSPSHTEMSIHSMAHCPEQFLPQPIQSAYEHGTLEQLAEFRRVTTLFMKLNSYSPTEHKDLTSLQPFYHAMQEIIYECGGYIRQFIIDDKGCVLIVLWGVPTSSFPNNCSRAVRCAASMSAKTASLNHACSIGITTGTAYCGTVGSSRRQDYVAMGSSVNLSARFMSKAESRILIDQSTYDSLYCDVAVAFSQIHDGLILKGFDKPVAAFLYDSLFVVDTCTCDVKRDTELVIRDKIQEQLNVAVTIAEDLHNAITQTLSESSSKQPSSDQLKTHVLILKGARGTGKTTLLMKYYRDISRKGVGVVSARISVRHATQPYAVFRKLFKQWLSPKQLLDSLPIRYILLGVLKSCFPYEHIDKLTLVRLPVLLELMGYSTTDDSRSESKGSSIMNPSFWSHGPFQWMWKRTAKVVSQHRVAPGNEYGGMTVLEHTILTLTQHLARECRSTVLLIDGAECMCEGTWSLLLRLASDYYFPAVIVLSVMDQGMSRDLEKLAEKKQLKAGEQLLNGPEDVISVNLMRQAHIHRSHSNPSPGKISNIASAQGDTYIWRFGSLPDTMIIQVGPLSDGQITTLIQNELCGEILTEDMLCVIKKVSQGLPAWALLMISCIRDGGASAMAELIANQCETTLLASCILSRYSLAEQSVLKHASVIGEEIYIDVLSAVVSPQIRTDLFKIIKGLVKDGVFSLITPTVFCFQNCMVRDMIRGVIPPSDVTCMHYEVVRAYESLFGDKLKQISPQLAYHYALSPKEHRLQALKYSILASKLMLDNFELSSAYCYLTVALKVSHGTKELRKVIKVAQRAVSAAETMTGLEEDSSYSDVAYRLVCLREKMILVYKERRKASNFIRRLFCFGCR